MGGLNLTPPITVAANKVIFTVETSDYLTYPDGDEYIVKVKPDLGSKSDCINDINAPEVTFTITILNDCERTFFDFYPDGGMGFSGVYTMDIDVGATPISWLSQDSFYASTDQECGPFV